MMTGFLHHPQGHDPCLLADMTFRSFGRVAVSLHVLGMPFEFLSLSPFTQAAAIRRISAIGRMPVLILDDGDTLIESAAILD